MEPVAAILRTRTTTVEAQETGVGTGLHGARPIEAKVTCAVQSATVDVSSTHKE